MEPDPAREYLVVLAGVGILAALMVSTIQQVHRGQRLPLGSVRLHPIEALARLALGAGLVLLALFLLAGRTVWADEAAVTPPAWAASTGLVLLASVLLAGVVVAAFAAGRRLRSKPR